MTGKKDIIVPLNFTARAAMLGIVNPFITATIAAKLLPASENSRLGVVSLQKNA